MITEALIEMHFHRTIVEHFGSIYGARFLQLLKPSQQKEAWVGFDQGWINISIPLDVFFDRLKTAIRNNATEIDHFYIGYFLQFKQVDRMMRRSKYAPDDYIAPYLRVELSLDRNEQTGLSQHETLLRLSNINSASVCYACGMLLDLDEIYEEPNLEKLQCVDLRTAPNLWQDDERHFISFRNETDSLSKWCSDPVTGKSLSFKEWASPESMFGPKKMTAKQLLNLINKTSETIGSAQNTIIPKKKALSYIPLSFTIIEFKRSIEDDN
jgi:hypothetical protein